MTPAKQSISERHDSSEVLSAINELKDDFADFRVFYTKNHAEVENETKRAHGRLDNLVDPPTGRIPKLEKDVKTLMELLPFIKGLTILTGIVVPMFLVSLFTLLWLLLTHQIEIIRIISTK